MGLRSRIKNRVKAILSDEPAPDVMAPRPAPAPAAPKAATVAPKAAPAAPKAAPAPAKKDALADKARPAAETGPKKIDPDKSKDYIKTVRGVGYTLN